MKTKTDIVFTFSELDKNNDESNFNKIKAIVTNSIEKKDVKSISVKCWEMSHMLVSMIQIFYATSFFVTTRPDQIIIEKRT